MACVSPEPARLILDASSHSLIPHAAGDVSPPITLAVNIGRDDVPEHVGRERRRQTADDELEPRCGCLGHGGAGYPFVVLDNAEV